MHETVFLSFRIILFRDIYFKPKLSDFFLLLRPIQIVFHFIFSNLQPLVTERIAQLRFKHIVTIFSERRTPFDSRCKQ